MQRRQYVQDSKAKLAGQTAPLHSSEWWAASVQGRWALPPLQALLFSSPTQVCSFMKGVRMLMLAEGGTEQPTPCNQKASLEVTVGKCLWESLSIITSRLWKFWSLLGFVLCPFLWSLAPPLGLSSTNGRHRLMSFRALHGKKTWSKCSGIKRELHQSVFNN